MLREARHAQRYAPSNNSLLKPCVKSAKPHVTPLVNKSELDHKELTAAAVAEQQPRVLGKK